VACAAGVRVQRVGHGFDVHRLAAGRELRIGGVRIPFARGLAGHSDADVLLHAVADACLGAAGMGDIGVHFPATDPATCGADSRTFLRAVQKKLAAAGHRVTNVDATVIAEAPPIAPHAAAMAANIAADLGIGAAQVNIKATTTEGLGFTGRGEGIAAAAVVMLVAE